MEIDGSPELDSCRPLIECDKNMSRGCHAVASLTKPTLPTLERPRTLEPHKLWSAQVKLKCRRHTATRINRAMPAPHLPRSPIALHPGSMPRTEKCLGILIECWNALERWSFISLHYCRCTLVARASFCAFAAQYLDQKNGTYCNDSIAQDLRWRAA